MKTIQPKTTRRIRRDVLVRGLGVLLVMTALGSACEGPLDGEMSEDVEVSLSALTSGPAQINCGGGASSPWVADVGFSTPSTITPSTNQIQTGENVVNPAPKFVYETGRSSTGTLTYTLPGFAKDSTNLIRLHFSESKWTGPGQRLFNILINGSPVINSFDIVVAAGGPNLRVIREFVLPPNDQGQYVITLVTVKDAAFINGIAISAVPAPVLPPATRIHAGGGAIGTFGPDTGFTTASTALLRANTINTTGVLHAAPAALYQTQRFGDDFTYTIPAIPGSLNTVRLHFCETKNASAGLRSFNVDINDERRISALDLAAIAGQNKAVVREFSLKAGPDGKYRIRLTKIIDKALISGIEVVNTVPWFMRRNMTATEYQAEFDSRNANGYRLVSIDGYTVNGTTRFAAVWNLGPGAAFNSKHDMTAATLQAELDAKKAAGFSLSLLKGYAVGTSERYAAIWEVKSPAPTTVVKFGLTPDQYQAEFTTQLAASMRLVHLSGYAVNGQHRFAAMWQPRTSFAWSARHMMGLATLEAEISGHSAIGDRLVDVSGYNVGGTDFYNAVFEASPGRPAKWQRNVDTTAFGKEADDYYREGYQPMLVSAFAPASGTERYAAIWENPYWSQSDLIKINNTFVTMTNTTGTPVKLPSVSAAITNNGALVFARASGVAKKGSTPTSDVPAHVSSLYRIGSLSKAITNAGIMKAVELGKLNLSSKVFGTGSVTGLTYGSQPYHPEVPKVNVRQLLDHTSGWIFKDTPILNLIGKPPRYAVDYSVDIYPTGNKAGLQSSYSNAGYMVLARVLETVTTPPANPIPDGQFESWMKTNVLAPMDITAMRIGKDDALWPDEVTPYRTDSIDPMGDPIKEMAGNGGWIGTPIDLVRFAVRMDRSPSVPDFLSPQSETNTFTASLNSAGYGQGWNLDGSGMSHNGSMAGSTGMLRIRTNTVRTFAVLTNLAMLPGPLDGPMSGLIDTAGLTYPNVDLFTPMDKL